MTSEEALNKAGALLAPLGSETPSPDPLRKDAILPPASLPAAAAALVEQGEFYLSAITGMDLGPEAGQLEVLYHFCHAGAVVTLRVQTPRQQPEIPTICGSIPHASLYEREVVEMLGVNILGAPDTSHLYLPEDWPANTYPLRKDFVAPQAPDSAPEVGESQPGSSTGRFVVPIGPQHPALKEPGRFEFSVDGEIVTGASVRLGYVHRGIEKACEERNWTQGMYLLERVCGICSHTHAFAYVLAVEKLAGVEAPPRAQAIRELLAGLERIHSHLLWLGVAAHEAGFDTLFMYSWRDRETVMDLLEKLTGNRVNYSANILGGVKCEITSELAETIRQGLDFLENRAQHYLTVVTTDASFLQRTRGIGVTTYEQALHFGLLGPTARASGLVRDIRVEAPYGAYKSFPVSVVKETAGDLEAKFIVRIKEIFVSCAAIRMILDNLPGGELAARMPRKIPAGEAISRVEAPRGELFYFVKSNGGEKPERVHARTPSVNNFASVMQLAIGHQLADVPMILAGIDPCFSCNDRMVVLRPRHGSPQVWSWDELLRYANQVVRR
jgi:NADH-quinone oxidoreductase subunit D